MHTAYVLAIATGVIACVTDVRTGRIPNGLTFGSAIAAVLFHAVDGAGIGLGQACAGWSVGVAFFFFPFALGGLGGGDVKLMGALGAWLGPADAIWLGLYSGVAGGVLALGVSAAAGYLRQALSNVWLLLKHWTVMGPRPLDEFTLAGSAGPRLAYAVPIFVGTVVTIWLR
jgi:prepilin peptidase CpaA